MPSKRKGVLLEEGPYKGFILYGPFCSNKGGKITTVVVLRNGHQNPTIVYSRYLLAEKLERRLGKREAVSFIDGNPSNLTTENVQLAPSKMVSVHEEEVVTRDVVNREVNFGGCVSDNDMLQRALLVIERESANAYQSEIIGRCTIKVGNLRPFVFNIPSRAGSDGIRFEMKIGSDILRMTIDPLGYYSIRRVRKGKQIDVTDGNLIALSHINV